MILETARNLVSYGESKGDAQALVSAARMVAGVPGRVLADGETGAAGAAASADFDIDAVLKKAEALAKGDALIAKAAGDIRATAKRDSDAACYWQYYCYYKGKCEYTYTCW